MIAPSLTLFLVIVRDTFFRVSDDSPLWWWELETFSCNQSKPFPTSFRFGLSSTWQLWRKMSETSSDKFRSTLSSLLSSGSQHSSSSITHYDERVYSISQISPDPYSDTWRVSPALPKKSRLIRAVYNQFKRPDSFDISVQIDDFTSNCFMLTLQCYSKFFRNHSTHEKVIKLSSQQISPPVFSRIYEWMLSSPKKIQRLELIPLLQGAEFLEVELLEGQIWSLIQDGLKFQESEAFLLYLEARLWGCEKVRVMMMQRVQRFFMTVVSSEDFLLMEAEEVKSWLMLDSIAINSELELFYMAARWLLHDWNKRKDFLIDLVGQVRFGLLPPHVIVEFQMKKNVGKLEKLLESEKLQEILESSLSYATYRINFNEQSEQFTEFLTRFGYKILHSRETPDPHWHSMHKASNYSYKNFERYLNSIKFSFLNWKNWALLRCNVLTENKISKFLW